MNLIEKYHYVPMQRETHASGSRHYICPDTGKPLPSVTTILDKTADKTGLLEWRKRVGEQKAEQIRTEATGLGTLMHTHLECFIADQPRPTGNNLVRQQAEAMADQIIEYGLSHVSGVYGSEVALYMPGLYAGTADGIAMVHNQLPFNDETGVLSIIDFKSARKMKKREYIQDYFLQMAAYAIAHNHMFDTDITQGVIYMVDRDFQFAQFVLSGAEFEYYRNEWFNRLEQYYRANGTTIHPVTCVALT